MFHRGFRGTRRRNGNRRQTVYKKVLNILEASQASGFTNERIAIGVDSVALGQTSNTDTQVPTGSYIEFVEVQLAISNLASIHCYINCSLQYLLSGQTVIDPQAIGGNPQRNQVLHQQLFTVGQNQNSSHNFKFKIPKQFQRLREGMSWQFVWSTNQTVNRSLQIIYRIKR